MSPLDQPVSFVAGLFYSDTSVNEIYTRDFVGAPLGRERSAEYGDHRPVWPRDLEVRADDPR